MPEIVFVFGPNGSFFFDCPSAWKFDRIPGTLRQLFTSSMTPAWRIAQTHCVALAPQINSPEPLWYVGCRVMTGEDKLFYSQSYFEMNYADLCQWTKMLPNASTSCFVTFGLNFSYFASAPGQGSIWAGIPPELEDTIRKSSEIPCCVSLGVHNTWFVLWPDGTYKWKLSGCYGNLEKILGEAPAQSVSYVAISPYSETHYFIAFGNQTLQYDFTGAPPEWMRLMTEAFDALTTTQLRSSQQPLLSPQCFTSPHLQLQQRQVACHHNNTVVELASGPTYGLPMSPPLTPNVRSSAYSTSTFPQAASKDVNVYHPLPQNTTVMPAELPDHASLAADASVPMPSIQTEKKKKRFLSRIF